MPRFFQTLVIGSAWLLVCAAADAQTLRGYDFSGADRRTRIQENHWILVGNVELTEGETKIYADEVEVFLDEDRAVATGNVTIKVGTSQISADRADFNTKTRLGTFYNATGIASLRPPKPQASRGGAMTAPQPLSQDTDVYFFGETIEKIGAKKYKITNGGFSTCVQPTPRWDLHAETVILNVDHYTVLKQAVLTVKGVPMFYTPFMYYPTKKEQRATGFLIPTYGTSTLRGQQIHNAFFWAIDRSQDATFMHEWYSKVGQGVSGEYRYNFGGGDDGTVTAHVLNQHEATYDLPGGGVSTEPASRSYNIVASANQVLPGHFRARMHANYFSSFTTNQTYSTNVYDATNTQRTVGGNVVGSWGGYSLNGTFDRTEYFSNATNSNVTGGAPRFTFNKTDRPLFGSDVYYSLAGEYVNILRENRSDTVVQNQGLSRVDFNPQIRYPFKKWQWFTVNTSLQWRDTFYTRSIDPTTIDPGTGQTIQPPTVIDQSLNRRFFTVSAQMTGPLFTRIWDTPDSGYAEKFKHSVEPFLNIQRTSSIDNAALVVPNEGIDTIVGGTTQYAYGVNNRFYAKTRQAGGRPGMPREIIDVQITQTYYTNKNASLYDLSYQTSFNGAAASNFSPIALSVRGVPTSDLNITMRAEFDSRYHSLRTISFNGGYNWSGRMQTTVGWSKRGYIPQLQGFSDRTLLDQSINTQTNVHTKDNRVGGIYSFNYDILRSTMVQQSVSAFYNAQCCGIAFQFQSYNFPGSGLPVPADHRFFLSFTLAGLGNFSPFNGALSGTPR